MYTVQSNAFSLWNPRNGTKMSKRRPPCKFLIVVVGFDSTLPFNPV
jgi:hypothetical protein